jgi:hypothetical protein
MRKKKSVRDRLGDKIEPEQPPARNDKSEDTKDNKVDKSRDKKESGKKDTDKRSSSLNHPLRPASSAKAGPNSFSVKPLVSV